MIRLIKCVYIISIFILWILSVAVLILSTIIRDSLSSISLVAGDTIVGNFYLKVFFPVIFPITITVACFIFVIGCVGYCGVFTNSQTLLGWFFITMLVAFCVELSAGIWRIVENDLVYNSSDVYQLQLNIEKYNNYEYTPLWFKESWIEIHQTFECCGVESYKDWLPSDDPYQMLLSCCPNHVEPSDYERIISETPGCGAPLLSYMSSSVYIKAMPYVTGIMGAIQVLTMILTLKIWMFYCVKTKKMPTEENVQKLVCQYKHSEIPFYQIGMEGKYGQTYYLTPLTSYKDSRLHRFSSTCTDRSSRSALNFNQVVPAVSRKYDIANVVEEESTSSKRTKDSKKIAFGSSIPQSRGQMLRKKTLSCQCKAVNCAKNDKNIKKNISAKNKRFVIGSDVTEELKVNSVEEQNPLLTIENENENINTMGSSNVPGHRHSIEKLCNSSSLHRSNSQIDGKIHTQENKRNTFANEKIQLETPLQRMQELV